MKKYLISLIYAFALLPHVGQSAAPVISCSTDKCWAVMDPSMSPKQRVEKLLKDGSFADAYGEYLSLLRQDPGDEDIIRGLANAAEKSGNNNQAVMALEMLQEQNPGDSRILFDIARNYAAMGDNESAAGILSKSKDESLFFYGRLNIGFMLDTNPAFGPDTSSFLSLANWNVNIPGQGNEFGTYMDGSFLDGSLNAGMRIWGGSFWLIGDLDLNLRHYDDGRPKDARDQASNYMRAAAGVRHATEKTLTDVKLKMEVLGCDLFGYLTAPGIETTFLWAADPMLHLGAAGAAGGRAYSEFPALDGAHWSAGGYARIFLDNRNYELIARHTWFGQDAAQKNYGHDGTESMLALGIKNLGRLEITPHVTFGREYYGGPAMPLETESREDSRISVGADFLYRISRNWAAAASYAFTDNKSTSGPYNFNKHLAVLGVNYGF